MYRVHVLKTLEVTLNGKIATISPQVYNVDDISFCNDNHFMMCDHCKDYFLELCELGPYHPKYDERKQKVYCITCFNHKYK